MHHIQRAALAEGAVPQGETLRGWGTPTDRDTGRQWGRRRIIIIEDGEVEPQEGRGWVPDTGAERGGLEDGHVFGRDEEPVHPGWRRQRDTSEPAVPADSLDGEASPGTRVESEEYDGGDKQRAESGGERAGERSEPEAVNIPREPHYALADACSHDSPTE